MGENKSDILSRMARIGREGPPLTPADHLRATMLERAQFQAAAATGSGIGRALDDVPGMSPVEREERYQRQIAEYTQMIPETQRAGAVLGAVDELARFWQDQLATYQGNRKAFAERVQPHCRS